MIGYITLGTNDIERGAKFYDALLRVIGASRFIEAERIIAWHTEPGQPGIAIIKPADGQPATVGNGAMIALTVDNTEKVDALHNKALELGGSDEGAPGLRTPVPPALEGFYAGYFRDLDGNKLAVFCIQKTI